MMLCYTPLYVHGKCLNFDFISKSEMLLILCKY